MVDWEGLRKPFPREQIGKLPATAKRPALDYVGHAAVTDRLNKVCPGDWVYTIDELFSVEGTVWLRGTLTIGGISRPDYGDGDNPKEAVGNFLRRAAMRFGVALDLWSREELESSPAGGPASSEVGVPTTEPAEAPRAGGTPSDGGEASDPKPGEANTTASPGFPIDPAKCDHKTAAGKWVKWKATSIDKGDGITVTNEVCPKCGTAKLVAMEGTTADLGPA